MIRPLVSLAAVALLLCSAASAQPRRPADQFAAQADSILPRLMIEHGVPGVAVALVENGEVAWSAGYGLADIGTKRPMTPETTVNVGSVSKSLTAWAVMSLVEQGRVDLDAPISDYVDAYRLPSSAFDVRGVSVRRLLNHTAGTSQHGVPSVGLNEHVPSLVAALSAAEDGTGVSLVAEPGRAWRYSGGGITLLQLMIETVTGMSYDAFVRETVLGPLGMTSSGFGWPPDLLTRAATPYGSDGQSVTFQRFAASGAAGLTTTALDLATFAAAAVEGGSPPGRGVLQPSTLGEMWADPAAVETATWPYYSGSGLGYFVDRVSSESLVVGHDGSNTGWQAMYRVLAEQRTALVIVTNSSNGWVFLLPTNALTRAWYTWAGVES